MKDLAPPPQTALRPAADVMRLARMGASFPSRLSFMRILLRRMVRDRVRVKRPVWQIDAAGHGHAVYSLRLGGHDYALVAVSNPLAPEARSDRVIATAWDSTFVLYDGIPEAGEIARIIATAPRQEAARYTERDLVLSRANRSVRVFDHVVAALRAGRKPDPALIRDIGYLMRTTAVYGNGKFGIADRAHIAERPGLEGPFMAEMLTVWLIRGFSHDLVEHMGGAALAPAMKRHLGIGNATGLGMAPFLVHHPLLLDAWMQVRETALARVRAVPALSSDQIAQLTALAEQAGAHLAEWQVPDRAAADRLAALRADWARFAKGLSPAMLGGDAPIDRLIRESQNYSLDLQELAVSLALEPFGDLIDGLADCMATPFVPLLDPAMPCAELAALIARDWEWATEIDFDAPAASAQFWYVSEAKLEPRLGNRLTEPGADRETPLDIARQVKSLAADLPKDNQPVGAFLARYPAHRGAARRVQSLNRHPYGEIRDNLIAADCLPIDLLRCKLAFFGAAKFDPKSDLWTRITLAQGAPLFDELDQPETGWLPVAGF